MKNTLTESTAFRTSLQVAEEFSKRHADVLRDIRRLHCSQDFHITNFQETSYCDKKGEFRPMYLMTKEGFTVLTMGYIGKKPAPTKEAIINNGELI